MVVLNAARSIVAAVTSVIIVVVVSSSAHTLAVDLSYSVDVFLPVRRVMIILVSPLNQVLLGLLDTQRYQLREVQPGADLPEKYLLRPCSQDS